MLYYISKIRIRPYRLAVRTAPSHGANSGSSPDKVTSKILKRTQFALGFLLFGAPYGNGEEHVGSREAIYRRRSPRVPF